MQTSWNTFGPHGLNAVDIIQPDITHWNAQKDVS
jgi:hypothetical protein